MANGDRSDQNKSLRASWNCLGDALVAVEVIAPYLCVWNDGTRRVGDGSEDGTEQSLTMYGGEAGQGKDGEGNPSEAVHEWEISNFMRTLHYKLDKIALSRVLAES